jgi:hypothetical protein
MNGLYLKSKAKDREKFCIVLVLGMSLISLLFGAYGNLGYFAIG